MLCHKSPKLGRNRCAHTPSNQIVNFSSRDYSRLKVFIFLFEITKEMWENFHYEIL